MKIFVTGVAGQLGYDVVHEFLKRGQDVTGSDLPESYPVAEEGVENERIF